MTGKTSDLHIANVKHHQVLDKEPGVSLSTIRYSPKPNKIK